MPQFQPYLWINMLTWTFLILTIVVSYLHTKFLPNLLKVNIVRTYILFQS